MPTGQYPRTESQKRKLSERLKANHHFRGKKLSAEHVEKLRISHLGKMKGPENPNWKGSNITKDHLHKRVIALRGRASEHKCVDCGNQAKEWSNISHKYIDEQDFAPRCNKCHCHYDGIVERMKGNQRGVGHSVRTYTPEERKRLNIGFQEGNKPHNTGKPFSEETLQKMRESALRRRRRERGEE